MGQRVIATDKKYMHKGDSARAGRTMAKDYPKLDSSKAWEIFYSEYNHLNYME